MVQRVLVANRGEIARRIFRTCREMGISTVAVFSDPDAREPHALEADQAVRLPGATPSETYLDVGRLIDAAQASDADAVHPGYGFLSENAVFARAVTAAGLTWIGPTPQSMELMGSKLESKRLIREIGVPSVPSVTLEDDADPLVAADTVGYPILVKASAGGGGKGMRVVETPDDLRVAVDGARREALGAFGDGTVFLERYLTDPRHIEVQILGDSLGQIVSLAERECSIQRRHQKIIEECPSAALSDEESQTVQSLAVAAARSVDYVGAGTVEFLFQDGQFFFLEMNTRLQVEHPVTEMVLGLDLVKCQIEIASGGHVPEVPQPRGHAIEARLYAEDPTQGFLPVTGRIHRFGFDTGEVRVDSGVENGSTVTVYYDPMLAKVIAHAGTRTEAAHRLASALRRGVIHGPTNNRALLVRILEHPEFLAGATDTGFLARHDPAVLGAPLVDADGERLAAEATALADRIVESAGSGSPRTIPSGWRNSPSQPHRRVYDGAHGRVVVEYGPGAPPMKLQAGPVTHSQQTDLVTIGAVLGENEIWFEVSRYGDDRYVDSDLGPCHLRAVPRFSPPRVDEEEGSLHAPMPGKVIRVEVTAGDRVEEGQVLIVMEAMKMEHTLRAPHEGRVTAVHHQPGDQVEAGAVLVVVEHTDQ